MIKRMYGGRMMTEEEIIAYRERKREYMRKRRANPEINEQMKIRTREWYKTSGRSQRQKEYLSNLKENHFIKWRIRLFNSRFKTKYTEDDFQDLWDRQNGRCALTGCELNKEAHIDHIIPLKKGGNHDLSNLRWTCAETNRAKRDLTDEEFLELCLNVIEFLGHKIMESLYNRNNIKGE